MGSADAARSERRWHFRGNLAPEDARKAARHEAEARALRTFRGVPRLDVPGVCSRKDHIYLFGYRQVAQMLAQKRSMEQLLIGKIAVDHLSDMDELDLQVPAIQHLHLAIKPDINEWIASFEHSENV